MIGLQFKVKRLPSKVKFDLAGIYVLETPSLPSKLTLKLGSREAGKRSFAFFPGFSQIFAKSLSSPGLHKTTIWKLGNYTY